MSVTVQTVRERRVGGGHQGPAPGRQPGSRAQESSASSKLAAQKWAESRERVLLVHGKPKPVPKEAIQQIPTLQDFALRFLDGYAKANRLKPRMRVHLAKAFGNDSATSGWLGLRQSAPPSWPESNP